MSTPQELEETNPAPLPSIILILREVEDPRVERTRKHHLSDILFISLCAVICGCESFEDMEEFGNAKEEWFRQYLDLPNAIPSHDTFNRVYQLLNPLVFQDCLIRWTQGVREKIPGEIVALDGKAQRRARNKNENLHYIVNAWAGENRLWLGQYKVGEKSNEITAIPELLRILELSGCIITCDAMGCQKNIAKRLKKRMPTMFWRSKATMKPPTGKSAPTSGILSLKRKCRVNPEPRRHTRTPACYKATAKWRKTMGEPPRAITTRATG